jgi:RHS repeat-associated protein
MTEQRDYLDGIEYKDGKPDQFLHSEGSVRMDKDGQFKYYFVLQDHLGNTRVTFSDLNNDDEINEKEEIIQINNYYAFGLNMEGNWNGKDGANKYQYNGKEWNDDFGLGWNHYGARFYDPAAARWWNKDILSERYSNLSPYAYVANNPIMLIDPTGMAIEEKEGRIIFTGEDAKVAFMAIKAKMNSNSGMGSLDKLNATLKKFAGKFANARKATKDGIERGYVIYEGSDNELYLSDMITGDVGTKRVTFHDALNAFKTSAPEGVTLTLAGIYHTHPGDDRFGAESDPYSADDARFFLNTVKDGFYYHNTLTNKKWMVATGFFVIADDVSGGRYAQVIEDLEVSQRNITETFNSYWDPIAYDKYVNPIPSVGTIGKQHRNYYTYLFKASTGIGVYHSASYSTSLESKERQ